jgi:hypothetical protein
MCLGEALKEAQVNGGSLAEGYGVYTNRVPATEQFQQTLTDKPHDLDAVAVISIFIQVTTAILGAKVDIPKIAGLGLVGIELNQVTANASLHPKAVGNIANNLAIRDWGNCYDNRSQDAHQISTMPVCTRF